MNATTTTAAQPLTLRAYPQNRTGYTVKFFGPDGEADARAAAWIGSRRMTHGVEIDFDAMGGPEESDRFPKVLDLIYPTCHHGMDGRRCHDPHGPHHFGTSEQDAAGW